MFKFDFILLVAYHLSNTNLKIKTLKMRSGKNILKAFVVVTLFTASFLLFRESTSAASISVSAGTTDTSVNGNCSLYEAVQSARNDLAVDACTAGSGADTLNLPDGIYNLSDSFINLNLASSENLTIEGNSVENTIIDGTGGYGITYSNDGSLDPVEINLRDLTVRNSAGLSKTTYDQVRLTITNTEWHNNSMTGYNAVIYATLANNNDEINIFDSTFRDNTGYTIYTEGEINVVLDRLQFYGNEHSSGNSGSLVRIRTTEGIQASNIEYYDNEEGIEFYANNTTTESINFYENLGPLSFFPDPPNAQLTASNISVFNNNGIGAFVVTSDAGGYNLDLSNITIANNETNYPGLFLMSDEDTPVSGTISNVTIANNSRTGDFGQEIPAGIGIASSSDIQPTVELSNVILSNNTDDGTPQNCVPQNGGLVFDWISAGNNLSSDATCSTINDQPTDLNDVNANLDVLTEENNTWVLPLQDNSPAVDAGATISSITTDQRGIARPQGLAYDIGAYELEGVNGGGNNPGEENESPNPESANNTNDEATLANTGSNTYVILLLASLFVVSGITLPAIVKSRGH
jgi:hypothetical protein